MNLRVYSGDLIQKVVRYIGLVRKCQAISDTYEKANLDTVLRLTNEMQASDDLIHLFKYWKSMKDLVEDLHNKLASRYIEQSIGNIKSSINDAEARINSSRNS